MISYARTLRFFFAAGISSVMLVTGVGGEEARYLRCESAADIEFYADVRADLPESFVADWVAWNGGCEWSTERQWDDVVETYSPVLLKLVDLEADLGWYAFRPEYER